MSTKQSKLNNMIGQHKWLAGLTSSLRPLKVISPPSYVTSNQIIRMMNVLISTPEGIITGSMMNKIKTIIGGDDKYMRLKTSNNNTVRQMNSFTTGKKSYFTNGYYDYISNYAKTMLGEDSRYTEKYDTRFTMRNDMEIMNNRSILFCSEDHVDNNTYELCQY